MDGGVENVERDAELAQQRRQARKIQLQSLALGVAATLVAGAMRALVSAVG